MGVGLCNYLENNILDWIFKQTTFGTAGAPPTHLYYGLHSADPGDTGANELPSTNNYSRANLDPDINNATNTNYNAKATGSPSTSQVVSNKADITFPQCQTADWNSSAAIQFYTCFDASTVGNALFTGSIGGGGVVVKVTNTLKLIGGAPGAMSFQLD